MPAVLVVLMTAATSVTSLPSSSPLSSSQLLQYSQVPPSQLLKAFGVSEPSVRRWHSEPPQYLLDLYNQMVDANGLTRLPLPYGATKVRTFSEKDEGKKSTFSYSISGLREEEEIVEVEFHVYHSGLPREQRHLLEHDMYMLEVRWVGADGQPVVGRQYIAANSSGWRVFRLGSGVVAGLDGAGHGAGRVNLEVTAVTLADRPLSLALHREPRDARRPLLVLFTTSIADTTEEPPSLNTGKQPNRRPGSAGLRDRRSVDAANNVSTAGGCQRDGLIVNFEELGWDFIVAPKTYTAYWCHGQCDDVRRKPNTFLERLMIFMGLESGWRPGRCAPTRYKHLWILYYDTDSNLNLEKLEEMVILECGCR